MKLTPVYFEGEISGEEVRRIFESAGYQIIGVGTQLIARRVPAWLRRDAPDLSNVRRLPPRVRKVAQ